MTKRIDNTTHHNLYGIKLHDGLPYAHLSKATLAAYVRKGWIVPVLSPNGRRSGRYALTKAALDLLNT